MKTVNKEVKEDAEILRLGNQENDSILSEAKKTVNCSFSIRSFSDLFINIKH